MMLTYCARVVQFGCVCVCITNNYTLQYNYKL